MSNWLELDLELERWDDPLRPLTLWWRDDDAHMESPLLDRALALSRAYGVPLGLAVIPAVMNPSFSEALSRLDSNVEVLQHGFAHLNHAGRGEKKSEFGEHRPLDVMDREIARGAGILRGAAPDRFVAMFVPPWNRITQRVLSVLPGLGFQSLSTFGARTSAEPVPGLRQVNTHVDLIDWRGHRGCRGSEPLLAGLVAHLRARRTGVADEATGILSHHLAHDDECWRFLDKLFAATADRENVRWLSASEAAARA